METSQVIIRPARPEEGEVLAVIEATCFPPAEAASREAVLERLATFPENFLVAEIDGKAIGFINGANTNTQYLPDAMYHDITLHKPDGDYQTVFGLNVLPDYQRHGIAAKLVQGYIDLAKTHHRKGIILTCKDHMIHYYERFGFVNHGIADSTHGGKTWNDMRLIF